MKNKLCSQAKPTCSLFHIPKYEFMLPCYFATYSRLAHFQRPDTWHLFFDQFLALSPELLPLSEWRIDVCLRGGICEKVYWATSQKIFAPKHAQDTGSLEAELWHRVWDEWCELACPNRVELGLQCSIALLFYPFNLYVLWSAVHINCKWICEKLKPEFLSLKVSKSAEFCCEGHADFLAHLSFGKVVVNAFATDWQVGKWT